VSKFDQYIALLCSHVSKLLYIVSRCVIMSRIVIKSNFSKNVIKKFDTVDMSRIKNSLHEKSHKIYLVLNDAIHIL
jgi:hypothetical protein